MINKQPGHALGTEDVESFLLGLALFAAGGGGTPERGRRYLQKLAEDGYEILWRPISEIAGNTRTCTVFGMGSTAPHPPMTADERAAMGFGDVVFDRPGVAAVESLQRRLGTTIGAIVPFELGAYNTVVAVDAAIRLGIPLVDGDLLGRAQPELSQALPACLGMPVFPIAICDSWGTDILLEHAASPTIVERLGKAISTVTKKPDMTATCAHAGFACEAREMANAFIPGTLSAALNAGRVLEAARRAGRDVGEAIAETVDGRVIFRGVVTTVEWADVEGYQIGETTLTGRDHYGGAHARIWFKNENHVAWVGEEVVATSPDLITVVNSESGEPRTNTALSAGESVVVVGLPAPVPFQSGPALAMTDPRHYGFPFDYQPLQ